MAVVGSRHEIFSLKKFAYCACNDEEKSYYNDNFETQKIEVKACCIELLEYWKEKEKHSTNLVPTVSIHYVYILKIKHLIIQVAAAQNGHVDCISTIASHAPSVKTSLICVRAASNGHLEFLKHAHELGFPWCEQVIEEAAAKNHLECLIYARENGCNWTEQACTAAVKYGHTRIVEYLLTNGCPVKGDTRVVPAEHRQPDRPVTTNDLMISLQNLYYHKYWR